MSLASRGGRRGSVWAWRRWEPAPTRADTRRGLPLRVRAAPALRHASCTPAPYASSVPFATCGPRLLHFVMSSIASMTTYRSVPDTSKRFKLGVVELGVQADETLLSVGESATAFAKAASASDSFSCSASALPSNEYVLAAASGELLAASSEWISMACVYTSTAASSFPCRLSTIPRLFMHFVSVGLIAKATRYLASAAS
eukprot:2096453-Rhodomonas_salina.4